MHRPSHYPQYLAKTIDYEIHAFISKSLRGHTYFEKNVITGLLPALCCVGTDLVRYKRRSFQVRNATATQLKCIFLHIVNLQHVSVVLTTIIKVS